jgi:hypothetical protein
MSRKPICANCSIEITWRPTIVDGLPYCCLGCSRGGPCECDYSRLPKTDDHTAIVRFATVAVQVSFPAQEPSSNGKSEQIKKKG